jgi:hypothetical protein
VLLLLLLLLLLLVVVLLLLLWSPTAGCCVSQQRAVVGYPTQPMCERAAAGNRSGGQCGTLGCAAECCDLLV